MVNMSRTNGFLLPMFMCFCVTVLCTDTDKCYLSGKTKNIEEEKLLDRISPLFGQTFRTEKEGFNYVIAICSDISKAHTNVSVTKSKIKNDMVILGRRNETYVDGGDTWVMLKYDCGDKQTNKANSSDSQCLGYHSASIYIICDPKKHDEPGITFCIFEFVITIPFSWFLTMLLLLRKHLDTQLNQVRNDLHLFPSDSWYQSCLAADMEHPEIKLTETDGCHYKFILPSISICEHEEELSGTTIFFMVLSIGFFMYFIVGIIYRRLVHNAQGCQQLPHFWFWQKIGAFLSDGCNYFCRCDEETENSWNNITSNFDNGDRDDAPLRP